VENLVVAAVNGVALSASYTVASGCHVLSCCIVMCSVDKVSGDY